MNKHWHYILGLCLLASATTAQANEVLAADAATDTAETTKTDTVAKTRVNRAQGFNALNYIMERRFRNHDDTFTKRWDDHLFLQLGMGMAKDVNEVDGRGLSPLVGVNFAVGKQISKAHTVRLTVGTEFGFREKRASSFTRLGLKLDWLYSLSTYIGGYNPARTFDLSTLVGVGYRTLLSNSPEVTKYRSGAEAHLGLQFKFFTGPQGYIIAEPYLGAASTNIARKFDTFYGVNLGFMYYIHNNLSPEQRLRYMKERPTELEGLVEKCTWQTPWFFEASVGMAMPQSTVDGMEKSETRGNTAAFAIGRWFSPALGMRLGINNTTTAWSHDESKSYTFIGAGTKESQVHYYNLYGNNLDLRLEAMINPFGFAKNYNWNRSWGFNLVFGGGVGWLTKNQDPVRLHVYSTFFGGGVQLWARLCDGMRLFVEPHYTAYNYRIPYDNVTWAKRYSENMFTVSMGLQAMIIEKAFRRKTPAVERETGSALKGLVVGISGGTNFMHRTSGYATDGMRFNFGGYIEYHFRNSIHGARLQYEHMMINSTSPSAIRIFDHFGQELESSTGMFKNKYQVGFASLSYVLDLSAAFAGRSAAASQRIHIDGFIGPTMIMPISQKSDLIFTNNLYDTQNAIRSGEEIKPKSTFGVNAGVKINVGVSKHIGITLTPQFYWLGSDPGFDGLKLTDTTDRFIETVSLGLQYKL